MGAFNPGPASYVELSSDKWPTGLRSDIYRPGIRLSLTAPSFD